MLLVPILLDIVDNKIFLLVQYYQSLDNEHDTSQNTHRTEATYRYWIDLKLNQFYKVDKVLKTLQQKKKDEKKKYRKFFFLIQKMYPFKYTKPMRIACCKLNHSELYVFIGLFCLVINCLYF